MSIVAIFLSAASILAIFYVGFLIGRIEDPAVCHVQESVKNSIASNIDVLTGTDAPCPPGFILRTDSESASDNIMVNDANSQSLKPADRENFEELLDSFEEDCKFGDVKKYYLHKRVGLIQDEIFDFVKHAAQPTKGDIIVNAIENSEKLDPMSGCEEMYLTRTGARESKSPKCGKLLR